jgi:hypothetical protein
VAGYFFAGKKVCALLFKAKKMKMKRNAFFITECSREKELLA